MKIIELPHKVCDFTCMVNGLEDLYEAKTGSRLPDWLFFYTGGMAGFAYIKNKLNPIPFMVTWGTTMKSMFRSLSEIVGFRWQFSEGRSFRTALQRAREYVDQGIPVVLGCLDMYHLPYYSNFFQRLHIPIHYVLMVGYDDDAIYVHDCGKQAVQTIPLQCLQKAWEVHVPGLSCKNTLHAFNFEQQPADIHSIAVHGLRRKAEFMLAPPAKMLGIPGMRKLAHELPRWGTLLSQEQLKNCLTSLVEFSGSPPSLPPRLNGAQDTSDDRSGSRHGLARLLSNLEELYGTPGWREAASLLQRSGGLIQNLTGVVIDHLLGNITSLKDAEELLLQAAEAEEQAYNIILKTN